jgi:chitinase
MAADSEIQDVLTRTNSTPVWDKTAAVKYFGFDDGVNLNQWVSFDDADTFKQKIEYAK